MKAVLWIPLGFLQGVIILLAWDQYLERKNHQDGDKEKDKWNRYHCKAVGSLCEGLPVFSIIIYASWSMNYPPESPVMDTSWEGEQHFLHAMMFIQFLSCGFGIVELDFCCSKEVCRRFKSSAIYETWHLLFRLSEFVSRTLMHVAFLVVTRWLVWWWWCPFLFGEILFICAIVLVYGGDETRPLVRLLCCVSCAWVNVFFFVDSPYKRRAARKITFWLDVRFMVEVVMLPVLAHYAVCWSGHPTRLAEILRVHSGLFRFLIFFLLLYGSL